jgi:hypothetical protein
MEQPLREFAAENCTKRFGEPERLRSSDGTLYRWAYICDDGRKIRLTLDSPEFPYLAHFLISDPKAAVMLTAETCRTPEDVLALLTKIEECGARGADRPLRVR